MSPGLIEAKTSFMRLIRNSSIAAPNQNLNGLDDADVPKIAFAEFLDFLMKGSRFEQ